ncbi:nucleotide sugar dehydrogenase [Palleronia sp. THAF1]|uniref:nucleotide sugar dehydrogenase n=1 Tax=Palleronia sp. THAF1 TaxID=2587842 RepID=UPI000F532A69|nr:nucleotide sugar dehydrogenase [Palleronia sp. THAF1]
MDGPIAVIGLGYVGLPLALAFGKQRRTIGFDLCPTRIAELREGQDRTREVSKEDLVGCQDLTFSDDPEDMRAATIYIIAVPTPINAHKQPDLGPICRASELVGAILKPGDLVIYESTVYPGATEEDCVPVLERVSGLTYKADFHCGYSPERINPGDRAHRLPDIVKVTSGSDAATADAVDALYASIITAGTFRAESIRVAEAAKVIENTQRDLNIALVNELAMIFGRMGIDTTAVLEAARSKWNFLPFHPGLVGGHCIGVDPYYLTHKAEAIGHHSQVILAGRRINDGMGAYVAGQMIKAMLRKRVQIRGARVLVLGLTFKENCRDLRNTRVVDVVRELQDYGVAVDVHDPMADPDAARREYALDLVETPSRGKYDGIILAVAHDAFRDLCAGSVRQLGAETCVIYDLKNMIDRDVSDLRL